MITIEPPSSPLPHTTAPAKPALARFLQRARKAIGLSGQVSVLLTSDEELKRLNRSFRGKNKPTDVLSFPAPEEIFNAHAGDLAISMDTAARQAESFGHPLDAEIRILLIHGLLHLFGHDHETDSGEMARREAELRARFRLPDTLIARTLTNGTADTPKRTPRRIRS